MGAFEWIALIGAAAWLPHIMTWLYRAAVTPRVYVVPDRELEVGYTNFGPIINVRASLFARRKDGIIEEVFLTAQHDRGREINLLWQGYVEKFSEIRSATGETAEATRDQRATALKLSTALPIDRFIRFQDPDFQQGWRRLLNDVQAEKVRLQAVDSFEADTLLQSREYRAMVEFLRHNFPWEAGTYTLEVRVKLLGIRGLFIGRSEFALRTADIDRLQQTVGKVVEDMEAIVRQLPEDEHRPGPYNWANPLLRNKDLGMKRSLLRGSRTNVA